MKTITITQLGEARHPSPVSFSVDDEIFTPADVQWPGGKVPEDLMLFEKAGPRKKLFFGPRQTRAAIVTCGGLCPGLNNVIRRRSPVRPHCGKQLRFGGSGQR